MLWVMHAHSQPILCAYFFVDGRLAIHRANSDIRKLVRSVSKWAASVAMAKLFDKMPPTTPIARGTALSF